MLNNKIGREGIHLYTKIKAIYTFPKCPPIKGFTVVLCTVCIVCILFRIFIREVIREKAAILTGSDI